MRWSGIATAALGVALATSAAARCGRPAADEVEVRRQSLGPPWHAEAVEVLRKMWPGPSPDRPDLIYSDGGSVVIYRGADCTVWRRIDFPDDYTLAILEPRLLGKTPVLLLHLLGPGGSAEHLDNRVLVRRDSGLVDVTPASLSHNNMDGLFVGDLGERRGAGLALWEAQWGRDDGGHYSPHRYVVRTWRWRNGAFEAPRKHESARRLAADPDAAARAMGFSFRDLVTRYIPQIDGFTLPAAGGSS